MELRKIGTSDMNSTVVSLGTWVFGGDCWGEVDDGESVDVIRAAIDAGVNFIDTAPVYGGGRSEHVIGKALKGRRKEVLIATKCGLEQKGHSIRPNLKADFIRKEAEDSLRRLGTDTIDLYQCHWPDPNTSLRETFGEVNSLKKQGKIRHIGVSNFSVGLLERAMEFSDIVSDQVQFSLFDRSAEKELIPFCEKKGISVLAYGPLGGGILTGKYKEPPELERGDVRVFFYKFYSQPFWGKGRALVAVLDRMAEKRGVPVSQVALNWVLSHRQVCSGITGCRTLDQLKQNTTAGCWKLDREEILEIEREYQTLFG